MLKVMIRDNMSDLARQILEADGLIEVVVDNDKRFNAPERLAEVIGEYDGLALRSGTRVTADVLERAGRLKVIGRAGVGVDNIDVAAATLRGIVVMNAPGGNSVTTAEHTLAMLFSLARHIPRATAAVKAGLWPKKELVGVEISGKTLGIIGLGQIGRVVAARARGLAMRVIASDPFVSVEAARALEVELAPLEEVYQRADFITLHVPRLKETVNMINAAALARMKPGVRLINCSRGDIIDLDALYDALEKGHVAGAALDVFPDEPVGKDLPLLQHPAVILTPHLGASTGEAQSRVAEMIARQMKDYLQKGVITHAVNFPSVSKEMLEMMGPHLILAERMGAMAGQLSRRLHNLAIGYSGEMARLDTHLLTHAVLKGLLGAYSGQPVNYVNAPALAKEKGIRVKEQIDRAKDDFTGLITVRLMDCDDGPDEIWGAIFGRRYPRIVRLGQIYLDVVPEGAMIMIQNDDKPGVIGNVGTTLGRCGINIGRFQLGRLKGRALCMVSIDTTAGEAVIEELKRLPNIVDVRQIQL